MKDTEKKVNLINLMAFIAFIVIALLEVFSGLNAMGITLFGEGSIILKILNSVKNVCILFVIGITAYKFVAEKPKKYKIIYWIAFLVFVVATVLMWIPKD